MKYLFRGAALAMILSACTIGWQGDARDFRQDMRDFVKEISNYAKAQDSDFIIIPQNGHELLTEDGNADGTPAEDYITAIDGVGREDLFYGYDADDRPTPEADNIAMLDFMDLAEAQGVEVLVTDYCSTHSYMDNSYTQNASHGFISFAADSRDLDTIPDYPPDPQSVHPDNVTTLAEAENFLYLLDPSSYTTKADYLNAINKTNYDLVIMDLFFEDGDGNAAALDSDDLALLKTKHDGGGSRLLICYMSIGEAEDYRFYWQEDWDRNPPEWIAVENPLWRGNYKVEYWNTDWQAMIYGSDSAYLDMIIAAGFDGVYLDIIDAYEFFEDAVGL